MATKEEAIAHTEKTLTALGQGWELLSRYRYPVVGKGWKYTLYSANWEIVVDLGDVDRGGPEVTYCFRSTKEAPVEVLSYGCSLEQVLFVAKIALQSKIEELRVWSETAIPTLVKEEQS